MELAGQDAVTESVVLSLAGGVLGLLLAMWGMDTLLAVIGDGLPRASEVRLDWRPTRWLANRLPAAGTHLRAGEWVSTGTASGMLAARAGTRVAAQFGTLPEIVVGFAA